MALDPRDAIIVTGARVHNLKDLSVQIPLHSLTVVTGVSGSGKSSLAFDTLYAEGQRRYVTSLSAYARQFLDRIDRPDVDEISGLCPALAIRQKNYSRNPRSTVGTVTEINDYLRLLYARIGTTFCHSCGRRIEQDTPATIAESVMSLPEETRLYLLVRLDLDPPSAPAQAGRHRNPRAGRRPPGLQSAPGPERRLALMLPGLQRQGFMRLLIGGNPVELSAATEALERSTDPEVYIIVDRLVVRPDMRQRLIDSLEVCGREADGRVEILLPCADPAAMENRLAAECPQLRWLSHPAGPRLIFSERFECQTCGIAYEKPEPRLFSFNNPFGACPECQGFGNTVTLDMNLVIPDKSMSLGEGAVAPWTRPRYRSFQARLLEFAGRTGIAADVPWEDLSESDRDTIIRGHGRFPGILGFFEHLEEKKYKMHVRLFMSRFRGYATCLSCNGERLRIEARSVLLGGRRITEVSQMTIRGAAEFFAGIHLAPQEAAIADRILSEIRHRLDLLARVGLDYITLDRLSSSLSGGESQRIQLAAALGSTLVGTLYVLDEPSIGLHPRDSQRLVEILRNLRALGNTLLVVEHDAEIMRAADYIIDLGPGAGEHGGRLVFQGTYDDLLRSSDSLTSRYLRGEAKIPVPVFRRKANGHLLELLKASRHNLKGIDVTIPLGQMVCLTGVSGSGKSTLVHDVLFRAIKRAKGELREPVEGCAGLRGAEFISDVVLVDQSPIGRTPRSNPATYTKAFDEIRELFAGTRDAYARNLTPGHFSFNLAGGRCETCQGNGTVTVAMQFLADVELTCEDCRGSRYKNSILEVRYKGKNISEVLDLTVHQAIEFFAGQPGLVRKLRLLEEIGLGYLKLGQSATSLSGGEAQRIKLAAFIARKSAAHTLYIFDEPTTGLHFDDIRRLLAAFDRLVDAGNSLLVIEHNLEVIKTADWIIDLGPEGGEAGGHIVFQGPPDEMIRTGRTHTAQFLRSLAGGTAPKPPRPSATGRRPRARAAGDPGAKTLS